MEEAKQKTKIDLKKERREKRNKEPLKPKTLITFEEMDDEKTFFGHLPIIQSNFSNKDFLTPIKDLNLSLQSKNVTIRCRIHQITPKGKLNFLLLREEGHTVQSFHFRDEQTSKEMSKFISNLTLESIVQIQGKVNILDTVSPKISQKGIEIVNFTKFYICRKFKKFFVWWRLKKNFLLLLVM
jgi:lysyl-tRNA synthetase class II